MRNQMVSTPSKSTSLEEFNRTLETKINQDPFSCFEYEIPRLPNILSWSQVGNAILSYGTKGAIAKDLAKDLGVRRNSVTKWIRKHQSGILTFKVANHNRYILDPRYVVPNPETNQQPAF